MSKYVARLRALIQEKHLPTEVPKVPKAKSTHAGIPWLRFIRQRWRQTIDDAGRFLDAGGSVAVKFDWTAGRPLRRAARW